MIRSSSPSPSTSASTIEVVASLSTTRILSFTSESAGKVGVSPSAGLGIGAWWSSLPVSRELAIRAATASVVSPMAAPFATKPIAPAASAVTTMSNLPRPSSTSASETLPWMYSRSCPDEVNHSVSSGSRSNSTVRSVVPLALVTCRTSFSSMTAASAWSQPARRSSRRRALIRASVGRRSTGTPRGPVTHTNGSGEVVPDHEPAAAGLRAGPRPTPGRRRRRAATCGPGA